MHVYVTQYYTVSLNVRLVSINVKSMDNWCLWVNFQEHRDYIWNCKLSWENSNVWELQTAKFRAAASSSSSWVSLF